MTWIVDAGERGSEYRHVSVALPSLRKAREIAFAFCTLFGLTQEPFKVIPRNLPLVSLKSSTHYVTMRRFF